MIYKLMQRTPLLALSFLTATFLGVSGAKAEPIQVSISNYCESGARDMHWGLGWHVFSETWETMGNDFAIFDLDLPDLYYAISAGPAVESNIYILTGLLNDLGCDQSHRVRILGVDPFPLRITPNGYDLNDADPRALERIQERQEYCESLPHRWRPRSPQSYVLVDGERMIVENSAGFYIDCARYGSQDSIAMRLTYSNVTLLLTVVNGEVFVRAVAD